jgi:hypothetical protein
MRRHAVDLAVLFVLSSAVCAYLALAAPGIRSEVLHAYLLVLGGLFMIALVSATGNTLPRHGVGDLERALAERNVPDKPLLELERVEREVALSMASAYDLHHRLLPELREVAQMRLERRGQSLAPEHVGRWWDLLRPDRPAPNDHFGPGIAEADLRALVDDLERI